MLAVRRLLAGRDTFQQNPSLPRDSNQRTGDFTRDRLLLALGRFSINGLDRQVGHEQPRQAFGHSTKAFARSKEVKTVVTRMLRHQ
jgi:hypothetical protein